MIGDFAKTPRYQGAGSSLVNPTKQPESILDVIGDSGLVMTAYEQGYIRNRKPNQQWKQQRMQTLFLFLQD